MAGYALGGILSGLMQGYDQQNEINRRNQLDQEARDDRTYQRSRLRAADQRAETEFANQQADRAHMLDRRPTLEAREDQDYGLQSAIRQLQLQRGQHDVSRMDIEDQQHDADFVLGQKAKQQQLAVGAMRAHLERMGIDDKALEASRAQAQKALGAGLAQAQVTGDWSGFVDGFNATVGRMPNAQPLAGIQRNSDGSLTMVMANGGKRQFADSRQLAATAAALTQPDVYLKSIFNSQFGHDGNGETEPASIKETEAVFKRLPPQEGEPESDRWMRAYAMTRQRAAQSPEDVAAAFYSAQMKDGGKPERALAATREFMSRFYPDAQGAWNGLAGQQHIQPIFADPGNGVAPPPRFAQAVPPRAVVPRSAPALQAPPSRGMQSVNHGRPIATAIDRDGRYGPRGGRVVRYEDGTVAPAN